jgi:hypothetical protein
LDKELELLLIVSNPESALFASKSGVDKLFVDLEIHGKKARQSHKDTVISAQDMSTVTVIRDAAPAAHLLVRLNPFHQQTNEEIDEAISRGADSLLLPYFHDAETLKRFFELVNNRVEVVPLFETVGSLSLLPEIMKEIHLKTIHIGLNDLHLERRDPIIFSPLALDVLEKPCEALRANKISFGIGGLARAGEGIIPPEILLGEHVRLGSNAAILSRTFHREATTLQELTENMNFAEEIIQLRKIYSDFCKATPYKIKKNRHIFKTRSMKISAIQGT